jgi:hypothetical protein
VYSAAAKPSGPVQPIKEISLQQAMQEDAPACLNAIDSKLKSLKQTNTYLIVTELPKGRIAIGTKWVLRRKFNLEGEITRVKARIVAKGYRKVYGLDHKETFASVVRYTTVLFLLIYAAVNDLVIDYLDVNTAFLNPPLKEEVYMQIPEFF